jgi:hypothetical protein
MPDVMPIEHGDRRLCSAGEPVGIDTCDIMDWFRRCGGWIRYVL